MSKDFPSQDIADYKKLSDVPPSGKLRVEEQQQIVEYFAYHASLQELEVFLSPKEVVDCLQSRYQQQTQELQQAFVHPELMKQVLAFQKGTYPYLGIYVKGTTPDVSCAYGNVGKPGFYGTTVTQPDLFSGYLLEQLEALFQCHQALFVVGQSQRPIPISFLQENVLLKVSDFYHLKPLLVLPSLRDIDDDVANGLLSWDVLPIKPLSLFGAERVDYSLGRLKHYCGTSVEHFQRFILMTNYQRYIDDFFYYAKDCADGGVYTSWVEPESQEVPLPSLTDSYHREVGCKFQMPAYHLKRSDGNGITIINVGVGPSNTKTITDHLAVLRSHCWMMLGHCGGLHHTQRLGDYVMANSYMRDDHVLDEELPLYIPIPPIAEVQKAIAQATSSITGIQDIQNDRCFRSGTVVSTGNRNWELRIKELSKMLNVSRALAVDMESATLAANAFRFCIPYGVLLCVSDKPLHGELKLHNQARLFYQERVQQHLRIGIQAMELMASGALDQLHSRKLRGFQGVPFR